MKYIVAFSFLTLFTTACSGQFGKILKDATKKLGLEEISTTDVANGLKEALAKGSSHGSDLLSAQDGYYKSVYKILLPDEAKAVCDKLSAIPGFNQLEENMIEKINRAAEDAATKAKPIFLSAIQQMTIADAWNILKGNDDAATVYLQKTTSDSLHEEFNPVIVEALNKQGALDYWAAAVKKYNMLPFVKPANPDFANFVTTKALNGLFQKIAEEELDIRHNLASRTSDLLRKVFAKQDKK